MPVLKCPNGKWRIGSGPCMYKSKAKADAAYRGYRHGRAATGLASKGPLVPARKKK